MPPGNPFVRRDIWSLQPDDPIVIAYGDAITAMKAKASSNPRSWSYQAAIHGTAVGSPPALANECRHQSWYFAPWHRMYLYYFERIVRAEVIAAGGPATWALPFWDYDRSGTNTLPLAFRQSTRPDGSPNPLFVANRNPGINSGAGALPSTVTSPAFALSRPNFTGTTEFGGGTASPVGQFQGRTGRLEQTPHNDIHVQIGGLMGDPATAALDPIFWLHHANIDRLWAIWDDNTHANPSAATWADQSFSFFDADGAQVSLRCKDVADTVNQLDYTYQAKVRFPNLRLPNELLERFRRRPSWPPWIKELLGMPTPPRPRPPGPGPDPGPELVGGTLNPVRLIGNVERVRVPIDARAQRDAVGDATPQQVVLDIENIEAERNPGTVYGVYVNLPESPSPDDLAAHHVGNISLFGIERVNDPPGDGHGHGGMRVAVDITDLVARLTKQGAWNDDDIQVTFRPIGLELADDAPEDDAARGEVGRTRIHEDLPVSIGRVSIHMR